MTSLPFRAAFAVLAMPAIVAGYLPGRIGSAPERLPLDIGAWAFLGLAVGAVGLGLFSWTVRDFFVRGQGTLAPWDPPKFLVAEGSYRWSRNPMYVGVLLLIWGQGIWYRSGEVLIYGAVMAVIFHLRVVLGEEPWLAKTFPEPWAAYTMRVKRWGLFALLLSATPLSAQIVHPTPENLDRLVTANIRRGDTLSGDATLDALARRLRALRPVAQIGGEAAAHGADWGKIRDVTLDREGRILVLDEQDKSISRWSVDGKPLGRFGRGGEGPLEFFEPTALAAMKDGTVLVLDRAYGLKRFTWDSTAQFHEFWFQGVTFEDVCAFGNGIVGQRQYDDNSIAQIIGPDGTRIRGVGRGYKAQSGLAKSLSRGPVGCLPNGMIAGASEVLPYVSIWDTTGKTIATTNLVDFTPMNVVESPGTVTHRGAPEGYEIYRTIVPVGTEHFLVQVALHTSASGRERAEYAKLHTYLLSNRTGKGVYLGTTLPMIAGGDPSRLIGWRNDPVPEVVILR
jgi:protein-S-isoprenylcysteine O-methyltransferase Ste14